MSRHVFASGVPCTGKSWLGSWLAENCGYLHIDAERDDGAQLKNNGIYQEWSEFLKTGSVEKIAAAIDRLGKPVFFNWGFPMSHAFAAAAIRGAGFHMWWIRGNRGQARKAFVERGGINPGAFDRYMDGVERHWQLLELLFDHQMVDGFNGDGRQRTPEKIWKEITSRDKELAIS